MDFTRQEVFGSRSSMGPYAIRMAPRISVLERSSDLFRLRRNLASVPTLDWPTFRYLDRIAAYDKHGPTVNAILYVNPRALEQADAMDQEFKRTGKLKPLACVPIVLKDNFDTADMPTTAGSILLKGAQPTKDAFAVTKLRENGALVLGKANLQEFASGGISVSSMGG
jgi:Asp-tRNA(Asn)/Glu-tRNA(Gln) amidotransferase A subunit family amidase